MPIYEHQCVSCGEVLEDTRPMSQSSESIKCPCGGNAPRIMSLPGVKVTRVNPEAGDDSSYFDYGLGETIHTQRGRQYVLDKHNLQVARRGSDHHEKVRGDNLAHASDMAQQKKDKNKMLVQDATKPLDVKASIKELTGKT